MKPTSANTRCMDREELLDLVRLLRSELKTERALNKRLNKKLAKGDSSGGQKYPPHRNGGLIRFREKKLAVLRRLLGKASSLDEDTLMGIIKDYQNLEGQDGVVEKATNKITGRISGRARSRFLPLP